MQRRLPPLNAVRAFESAARLGRMGAAADELAVTPGAISRQVQLLERSLNLRLFEGSKNKPQLSAAGQVLLPVFSAALDSIDAAVRAVTHSASGSLEVACFSTFTVKWLIPRLFDFTDRYPDIAVRLQATGPTSDAAREACDVVVTALDTGSADPTSVVPLFPEQLGPVLAPALAARTALHAPGDLGQHTLLQSVTRLNAWSMWAQAQGCALPTLTGPVFEHYYFTLEAAVAGLGVCVAPWHLVAADVQAGRLLAPLGFRTSTYHYVAKRRLPHSAASDVFCAWLQTQAAAHVQAPSGF